ncbi:MAG TPA: hypothetical protein VGH74_19645, partial [Planctomycetaceae bacterium]
ADGPKRIDPDQKSWKIDPPAGERDAVRADALGEYGNWSRTWNAFAGFPGHDEVEVDARPGARLWDAESGTAVHESGSLNSPGGPEGEVSVVAHFSPDGKRVAIGGTNGTVVVRSVDDPRETVRFLPRPGNGIRSIEFSRDGRRLLICTDDGAMAICDSASGEPVTAPDSRVPHVRVAFFDHDGRRAFEIRAAEPSDSSAAEPRDPAHPLEPNSVAVLDAESLQQTGVFRGHSEQVTAGCLSPDGRYFTTGSLDGTARLWDVRGPADIGTVIAATRAAAARADQPTTRFAAQAAPTLSQDGRLMLAAEVDAYRRGKVDELARIIDVATGEVVSRLMPDQPQDEPFFKEGLGGLISQFSPDGKRLLTVSSDQHVRIIKPGTPAEILGGTPAEKWPILKELPFTPVRVWDVATGRELFHVLGLKCAVDWASFSPDGRRILTRSTRGESYCYVRPEDGQVVSSGGYPVADPGEFIRIWDAANGKLLWTVSDVLNPMYEWEGSITWGPDNHSFAASKLFGWLDFENKKMTGAPGIWSHDVLLFSPNGKNLLSRNADQAVLFEVSAVTAAGSAQEQFALAECGPDGEVTSPTLRTAGAGAKQVPLGGSTSSIVAAAFSGDGRWLAAATADQAIQIWDAGTGELRYTLRGHTRPASHVSFSGAGNWIVTASDDRTARVWDLTTGAEYVTLQGHAGPVRAAVFGSDSQSVITSSTDGTVRSMPLDPLKIAVARKPRELTPAERARFEVDE